MEYELVKYKYGLVNRYTAFCLTPRLDQPQVVKMGGRTWTVTNRGASSRLAKHFQRPEGAMGHLALAGQSALKFDWNGLERTKIRPRGILE